VSRSEKDVKFNWVIKLSNNSSDFEYRVYGNGEFVVGEVNKYLEDVMYWNLRQCVLSEKVVFVCLMDDNVDGHWSIKIGDDVVGSLERW